VLQTGAETIDLCASQYAPMPPDGGGRLPRLFLLM